jgi:hypothetical protein
VCFFPIQKDPEEYEQRLPVVMLRVEEFECRFNRNMYNVACTLYTGETLCFPISRMSRVKIATMGCGPGLDSTTDAVLYNAPAVIEWSSPHEQGRRLIGHRQRHVPWRIAC